MCPCHSCQHKNFDIHNVENETYGILLVHFMFCNFVHGFWVLQEAGFLKTYSRQNRHAWGHHLHFVTDLRYDYHNFHKVDFFYFLVKLGLFFDNLLDLNLVPQHHTKSANQRHGDVLGAFNWRFD